MIQDLWVLPTPGQSAWFAKIDWYLNWQLCKGLQHKARQPSVELLRVTGENDLPWIVAPTTSSALLVPAKNRVPARLCLVLEASLERSDTLQHWLGQILLHAQKMQIRSMRIFLPLAISLAEAHDVWRSLAASETDITIEFTLDEEAQQWPNSSTIN